MKSMTLAKGNSLTAVVSCRYLGHEDGVEALIQALDKRGAREGPLYNNLLRYRDALGTPGAPFRSGCSPGMLAWAYASMQTTSLTLLAFCFSFCICIFSTRKATDGHPGSTKLSPHN